jgi:hypothetical protein
VRLLAGILRIAVALDRSRQRAVADIGVTWDDERLRLSVRTSRPADEIELDLYTADQRGALLARALDRRVILTAEADAALPTG